MGTPALTKDDLGSVLENAPNVILAVDREGTILYINHVVPGLNKEDVVGKSQYDFVQPEHRDMVRGAVERTFRTGEPSEYEIQGMGADGSVAWYLTSVGAVRRDGEIVAVSLFAMNITDRKRAERALREAKEDLIEQQARAIRELQTPVLRIWDGVLVLPVIGTIDTARAQRIVENLLDSIVETQAAVAIMDITGVPLVDTHVADHLLKTIQAARMLGTELILTGVSPRNAQTLVKLGVDLGGLTTRSSLQSGLRLAYELTGQQVQQKT